MLNNSQYLSIFGGASATPAPRFLRIWYIYKLMIVQNKIYCKTRQH